MNILSRWFLVFFAATAVDLFVRFGLPFRMNRILWTEAVVFPMAGIAFLILFLRGPRPAGVKRAFQILIIAAFFLAGLRSGLWASGIPIGTVNLLVLVAAVVAWLGFRVRRSRKGSGPTVDSKTVVIAGFPLLFSLGCWAQAPPAQEEESQVLGAQTLCDHPDADPWVRERRDHLLGRDEFVAYATLEFGPPSRCHGKVETGSSGLKFGVCRARVLGRRDLSARDHAAGDLHRHSSDSRGLQG